MAGRGPKRRRWTTPSPAAEQPPADGATEPPEPELFMCPHCRTRHQPINLITGGVADLYGRPVVGDPGRPEPLGRGSADTVSLRRDAFNP
jgi:hypothetical protein